MKTNTKNIIKVKSLDGAEMRFKNDDGWTISANIRYNHHIIHVTYYRWLPKYEGWEPVRVTNQVLIHEWYYIDNLETVRDELQYIFETVLIAIMLSE